MILKATELILINDLFLIVAACDNGLGFNTTIKLNAGHLIYTGHFPGYPVTPGVIQMQIVHELLEKHLCKSIRLASMSQCKFLKILNPLITPQIDIHIELNLASELLNINARGENAADIFFKFNSVYYFI